ncbi:MAG: hypothetical protein HDT21_13855 [Ruminococcus sp.]|nr:hypothetical protein [Ruminococcus sp.]
MKNIKNKFTVNQIKILESIGIVFDDNVDYTDEMLMKFHDVITDNYLSQFDKAGNPSNNAIIYEQIIDIFYDEFDI